MSSDDVAKGAEPKKAMHERLMMLLKTRGAMQAGDAGRIVGTTGEAARQQFAKLAKEGLVESEAFARGVGRPVQMWRLTAAGHARFPDTHAELTVQLLRMIGNNFGEAGINLLIDQREDETRQYYQQMMADARRSSTCPQTLEDRISLLVQARTREGYMAQWHTQPDGSYLLVENHCPICAAAATCQGFCRAELAIFREVLQAKIERIEHILQGSRRCAYRIWL